MPKPPGDRMDLSSGSVQARSTNREISRLVGQVCLPFRSRTWRGSVGGWQGREQGASVDFQDHRAYVPGDDPRHLDWGAYARTDGYTMKLFRAEVSPRLDLALDVSGSMALTAEKEMRSLELLALVLGIARQDGISVRIYALHSTGQWRRLEMQTAANVKSMHELGLYTAKGGRLPLAEIPWRAGSLRVLISDLLLPQPPERELALLGRENGSAIILAPGLRAEAAPDWEGNLELLDCESRQVRQQRVEPFLLARYRKNYERHFDLWRQEARRRAVPLARISCELPLGTVLRQEALPAGAFDLRH
jgi:uncharacterized protein (DUF58 family)